MLFRRSCEKTKRDGGFPIVLTASAIEMSDFNLDPFVAFVGGFPLGIFPKVLLRKAVYPPVRQHRDGRAKFAPYGLRKVEAILAEAFGPENMATVHPFQLDQFVGPQTKAVAISTMDPLGLGFVSKTYTNILGLRGNPANLIEFEALLSMKVFRRYHPKILVGGAGAWQLMDSNLMTRLGIDAIISGHVERSVVGLFKKAMNNEQLDIVVQSKGPQPDDIPSIRNPSIYGTVEITRGCGRGCHFCSPAMGYAYSYPMDYILEEARINAHSGSRMIILQTDDLFLYQSGPTFIPNKKAIIQLIRGIGGIKGVEFIQIAHMSLPPIVYDPEIVREIGPFLARRSMWKYGNGEPCASVEIGIETGSTRLVRKYMKGKSLPYEPEQWQDIVVQATGIMNDAGINPLGTLILGLPGEAEEDVMETLRLLDKLKRTKIFYVPLFFTPEKGTTLEGSNPMERESLTDLHWEILSTCWRQNLEKWEPAFFPFARIANSLPYRMRLRALLTIYAAAKKIRKEVERFHRSLLSLP